MNPSASIGTAIVAPLIKAQGFGWCFTGLALFDLLSVGLAILITVNRWSWTKNTEASESQPQDVRADRRREEVIDEQSASEVERKES